MRSGASADPLFDESPAARRASLALFWIAVAALAGNCLLSSPERFSPQQAADRSPLAAVVYVLGLGAAVPTARGIEIRNLFFYGGAALLSFAAGLRLLTARALPRLTPDDLLDLRQRLGSPTFWWLLLLLVSILCTTFSHAPGALFGQTLVRTFQFAWWWPLALLLRPVDARRLSAVLAGILSLMAALGVWYYAARNAPGSRLQYPIGNELWMAACILPAIPLCAGLLLSAWAPARTPPLSGASADPRRAVLWLRRVAPGAGLIVALIALALTASRSAAVGLGAAAVAFVYLSAPRRWRPAVIGAGLVVAVTGGWYFQTYRQHSIRVRLAHEWPYALALFNQRMAGHGDGAYSLLAGRFARIDQLDDPNAIGFHDERSWVVHAHNEFLETLADLGVVGLAALLGALACTLWHAARFCDRAPAYPGEPAERWTAIALAAALVGLVIDSCLEPAFRQPGLPPILLTVWACLWALVRRARRVAASADDARRLAPWNVNLAGAASVCAALGLGYRAVGDWRGNLARSRADRALRDARPDDAVDDARRAAALVLDPFQAVAAQSKAVLAGALAFRAYLDATHEAPPSPAAIEEARAAWMTLAELEARAPEFLGAATLRAQLAVDFARAYQRLNDERNCAFYQQTFLDALAAARAQDPFSFSRVRELWRAWPDAPAAERLDWFRGLLRAGEPPVEALVLFNELASRADFLPALNDLALIARPDAALPPGQWRDRLSPESFRIIARAQFLAGRPGEALQSNGAAIDMYRAAGIRLFSAHAAALHESVRYGFVAALEGAASSPGATTSNAPRAEGALPAGVIAPSEVTPLLERLAESFRMIDAAGADSPPIAPTRDLPDAWGLTRLDLLLAADNRPAAESQLRALQPRDERAMTTRLAEAYLRLAGRTADEAPLARLPGTAAACLQWATQAAALDPASPEPHLIAAVVHLLLGEARSAVEAARRFLGASADRGAAVQRLEALRDAFPGSPAWDDLAIDLSKPPAPQPTSPSPP